jgi:hypothetical protein
MNQDVRQWLAEIRSLQQKLAEARQERDDAYKSAANWRKLYETEANQRRTEANLAQQKIAALEAELQEARAASQPISDQPIRTLTVQQKIEQLDLTELRQMLIKTTLECDRLTRALKEERENHLQTRNGLTAALGDTVELLTKERAIRSSNSESTPVVASTSSTSA